MSEHPPYAGQQPRYVPLAPDGRPLAGLGQRLGARLIDSLVLMVALLVTGGLVGAGLAGLAEAVGDDSPFIPAVGITAVLLLTFGLQYLHEVELCLRWNGRTVGKRLLKIAVVPLDAGVPLSRGKLAYRWIVSVGCNLLSNCYVGLLDPLWCCWDKPYRQCLHDKPARTTVVTVTPPPTW